MVVTYPRRDVLSSRRSAFGQTKTDIRDQMSVRGGARGIRTPDLLIANETRYQLRHSPKDEYTLAPSDAFTQADHNQRGFAPKTARQNDR